MATREMIEQAIAESRRIDSQPRSSAEVIEEIDRRIDSGMSMDTPELNEGYMPDKTMRKPFSPRGPQTRPRARPPLMPQRPRNNDMIDRDPGIVPPKMKENLMGTNQDAQFMGANPRALPNQNKAVTDGRGGVVRDQRGNIVRDRAYQEPTPTKSYESLNSFLKQMGFPGK